MTLNRTQYPRSAGARRSRDPVIRERPAPKLDDLPQAVVQFIQGVNAGDLESLLSAFAEDAFVNDQLCEYWGAEAIRRWAVQELIGKALTIEVVEARAHYAHLILSAQVDGDFDKLGLPNPLLLHFYFTHCWGKLVQLTILPKPEYAA
jgi:hypothetical protein